MKKVLSVLVAAGVFAALPGSAMAQPAGDPAELAEARAILAIMFPPAEREATFNKIGAALANQFRQSIPDAAFSDPGLKAIVDEALDKSIEVEKPVLARHLPGYFQAIENAYGREFSLAELKDIHAFALTPSGRHYLTRSSALISDPDFARENTQMMVDAQAATRDLVKELTAKMTAYLKAHPDVAGKIDANEMKD